MSNVIPIPEPIQREREARDSAILFAKGLRVDIAFILDGIKRRPAPPSAEMQKAIDYLKNARHWLGEELNTLGTARPYPNGDDCTTTKVDPPTDVPVVIESNGGIPTKDQYDKALAELHAQCRTVEYAANLTLAGPGKTPNASLPPIGEGPRRKMLVGIEVPADFEKRLDNQWVVEREIHADRWNWIWADTAALHPAPAVKYDCGCTNVCGCPS